MSADRSSIDPNSPIPIYHQLQTLIRGKIASGAWRPGDRIPTEHALCEMYNISRSPVRQALSELAQEGVLVRHPGRGTFVHEQANAGSSSDTSIQVMGSDPYWPQVLSHVTNIWNEMHPNEKASFSVDVVDHSQFHNLLSSAVGSGTAPDAAMVDSVWVAGLAQAGFLYSLQELDSAWDYVDFVAGLHPAFVEANSLDGLLYGIPCKADASLLWYRRDWLQAEGLRPPRDWDDLLAVGVHFLEPEVKDRYELEYPLAFPGGVAGGEATVYSLIPLVWSAGGDILDLEAGRVVLESAGTQRALQFIRDLVVLHQVASPEVTGYGEHTTLRKFVDGKVVMALGGSHESDVILDLGGWGEEAFRQRVGYVATPAAPGGPVVPAVGGISYVILRQSRNSMLTLEVLKQAVDPGTVGSLYRSLLQNSPCVSFDRVINHNADPFLTRVSHLISSGRARPSTPEYFKVSRLLQAMFEDAISGARPIEEIMRRTAEFVSVITELPC